MNAYLLVCVKPIPDPEYYNEIKIDPETKTIDRRDIKMILNPDDKHAIEAALRLKEELNYRVIVLSMAPPNTKKNIIEALAMGADEAYLLSDRIFAGSDTWATSYIISRGINKIIEKLDEPFLILTGSESGDAATGQVPPQLSVWLGLKHLWHAVHLEIVDKNQLKVKSKIENGYLEWKAETPIIVSVSREINKPRYTSIKEIMQAKKKPLTVLTAEDLELNYDYVGLNGSPTKAGEIFEPQMQREGKKISCSPEEAAELIIEQLKKYK